MFRTQRFLWLPVALWLLLPLPLLGLAHAVARHWPPTGDVAEPTERNKLLHGPWWLTRDALSLRVVPGETRPAVHPLWQVELEAVPRTRVRPQPFSLLPRLLTVETDWSYALVPRQLDDAVAEQRPPRWRPSAQERKEIRTLVVESLNARSPVDKLGNQLEFLLRSGTQVESQDRPQNALVVLSWLAIALAAGAMLSLALGGSRSMTPEQAAEESVTTVSIRGEVWNDALGWAALLLGAWLVLKVTQSAALAIVLATCKFGWNELLTAIWLRANDPVRPRGRACFWFCLLPGLWKILAASIVACVLLGLGASHWDLARQLGLHHKAQGLGAIIPINQAAWTALQTAAVMCAAFMVVSLIGRRQARQAGLRVWIDRALTRARHRAAWPPSQFTDENHADIAMGGAIIVALVLGMSGVLLIHRLFPQWPAEATLPALMAVSATAALVWASAFRCVIAVGPAECWPEQQGQPPPPG